MPSAPGRLASRAGFHSGAQAHERHFHRSDRLAALYKRSTALSAESRRARDPAYLAQIKEAIGRGGRVAVVIGAGHLRRDEQLPIHLHDELRKLGALIGTPRRRLPDEL